MIEVKVPDIGDFSDIPIIEVMVKPGDRVKPEDPLISLESDKATMDVPAPVAGIVKTLKVKVGDKVSEGTVILLLDGGTAASAAPPAAEAPKTSVAAPPAPTSAPAGIAEVRVPDIGDFKDVPVIEVLVKPGDTVKAEDALVTLESDKATMDVPAPLSGKVGDIRVKVGDKVSEGALIMTIVTDSAAAAKAAAPAAAASAAAAAPAATAPAAPAAAAPSLPPPPTRRASRLPTRARAYARLRASSASTSPGYAAAATRGASSARTSRRSRRAAQRRQRSPQRRLRSAAAWVESTCCRGRRWTSRSSAPWK